MFGLADVTSPTQDARCVANVNVGPRFTYWVRALKKVMTTSAASLEPTSLAARATQLGSCGPDMPYLENHLAPVAVRSHYEYYEVCNLNKGAMRLSVPAGSGNRDSITLRIHFPFMCSSCRIKGMGGSCSRGLRILQGS